MKKLFAIIYFLFLALRNPGYGSGSHGAEFIRKLKGTR